MLLAPLLTYLPDRICRQMSLSSSLLMEREIVYVEMESITDQEETRTGQEIGMWLLSVTRLSAVVVVVLHDTIRLSDRRKKAAKMNLA